MRHRLMDFSCDIWLDPDPDPEQFCIIRRHLILFPSLCASWIFQVKSLHLLSRNGGAGVFRNRKRGVGSTCPSRDNKQHITFNWMLRLCRQRRLSLRPFVVRLLRAHSFFILLSLSHSGYTLKNYEIHLRKLKELVMGKINIQNYIRMPLKSLGPRECSKKYCLRIDL